MKYGGKFNGNEFGFGRLHLTETYASGKEDGKRNEN